MKQYRIKEKHFILWVCITCWLLLSCIGISVYAVRIGTENARLGNSIADTSDKLERLEESINKAYAATVRIRTLIEFRTKQEELVIEWNDWMQPSWESLLEIVVDKEEK